MLVDLVVQSFQCGASGNSRLPIFKVELGPVGFNLGSFKDPLLRRTYFITSRLATCFWRLCKVAEIEGATLSDFPLF